MATWLFSHSADPTLRLAVQVSGSDGITSCFAGHTSLLQPIASARKITYAADGSAYLPTDLGMLSISSTGDVISVGRSFLDPVTDAAVSVTDDGRLRTVAAV